MGGWILQVLLAAAVGAAADGPGQAPQANQAVAQGPGFLNVGRAQAARLPREKAISLEESVRQALRRWAGVTDEKADRAARELLDLYAKLRGDDSLAPSTRSELQMKVRGRLARLAEQIRRHHARQARSAKGRGAESGAPAAGAGRVSAARPVWLGQAPGAWGQGNRQRGQPATALGAAGTYGVPDYGPDLVDLIQRTIAPDSWDVRGGPGSIYYWRPGRALVVRQTTEVHEAIADGLGQLRGADP